MLVRSFYVFLALVFLAEAWLWDHLQRPVAAVVNLVPWGALKEKLAALIKDLPPWAVLIVFVIPFIVLLPLKFLEVYFIATRQWLGACAVLLVAKLLGLGVTAFIFDVTRDKLLQMDWFRRLYDRLIALRAWAHAITVPVRERMRRIMARFRPGRAGRFMRRLWRLRNRASRA